MQTRTRPNNCCTGCRFCVTAPPPQQHCRIQVLLHVAQVVEGEQPLLYSGTRVGMSCTYGIQEHLSSLGCCWKA